MSVPNLSCLPYAILTGIQIFDLSVNDWPLPEFSIIGRVVTWSNTYLCYHANTP